MQILKLLNYSRIFSYDNAIFITAASKMVSTATAKGFTNPELYSSANKIQYRDNKVILDFFQKALKPSKENYRFLDIGCATGYVAHDLILGTLETPIKELIATDVSEEMILHGRKKYSGHPKLTFDVLDIGTTKTEQLVTKYGTFERIYSLYTLQWVKDLSQALQNIRLLCAPQGECLLTIGLDSATVTMYEILKSHGAMPKLYNHGPPNKIKETMEELGFNVQCVEALNLNYIFDKYEDLEDTIAATIDFTKQPDKEESVRNDLKQMIVKTRRADGTFRVDYKVLALHATLP